MTLPPEIRRELFDLFWSVGSGSSSPAEVERVERLAAQYPEVHALYAQFTMLCGILRWDRGVLLTQASGEHRLGADGRGSDAAEPPTGRFADQRACKEQNSPVIRPGISLESGIRADDVPAAPADSSPWILHPLGVLHGFGGVARCYTLVAALIGVGVLAAWVGEKGGSRLVGDDQRSASTAAEGPSRQQPPVPFAGAPAQPVRHTRIGRVVATVGCRWARPDSLEKDLSEGRIELRSGLLKIAHDGGAAVILEGPVSYTAESSAVGSLHYGRLVAVAGQIGPDREAGPHHPAFVIRTPGAVATNLVLVDGGAEFGVAVEPAGAYGRTWTHVFRGRVVLSVPETGSNENLSEGQTARLVVAANPRTGRIEERLDRPSGPAAAFVRQLPNPPLICWEDGPPGAARRLLAGTPIYAAETSERGLGRKEGRESKKPNS